MRRVEHARVTGPPGVHDRSSAAKFEILRSPGQNGACGGAREVVPRVDIGRHYRSCWIEFAAHSSYALDTARLAELREVVRVADRLEPHLEAVVAGHRHDIKLGLVEAINSKIGALRVQARGYRDPEYFKLKIFQRCGLVANPWAQVIL